MITPSDFPVLSGPNFRLLCDSAMGGEMCKLLYCELLSNDLTYSV